MPNNVAMRFVLMRSKFLILYFDVLGPCMVVLSFKTHRELDAGL